MGESGAGPTDSAIHRAPTDGIAVRDGEVVLANGFPSWTKWPKSWILGAFFGLVGILSLAGGGIAGGIACLFVAVGFFGYIAFVRRRSRYIVTNQRVRKHVGLLNRSAIEMRMSDVRRVTTVQTPVERLVGTGTVRVERSRVGVTLSIHGVRNFQRLAEVIRERLQRRNRGGLTSAG